MSEGGVATKEREPEPSATFPWKLLLLGVGVLAILALVEDGVSRRNPLCYGQQKSLGDFQKQAVSLSVGTVEYLMSLGMVVLGAFGALATAATTKPLRSQPALVPWSLAGGLLAVGSLYFGYVSRVRMLEMLLGNCVDLFTPGLRVPQLAQYYLLLASALTFVVSALWNLVKASSQVGVGGTNE